MCASKLHNDDDESLRLSRSLSRSQEGILSEFLQVAPTGGAVRLCNTQIDPKRFCPRFVMSFGNQKSPGD